MHKLDINSPCVHTHLELLKTTIDRFSLLGMNCKIVCATLLAALAFANNSSASSINYLLIGVGITIICAFMDFCYLSMENSLKHKYKEFIEKIKSEDNTREQDAIKTELFDVKPNITCADRCKALRSRVILPPYLVFVFVLFVLFG